MSGRGTSGSAVDRGNISSNDAFAMYYQRFYNEGVESPPAATGSLPLGVGPDPASGPSGYPGAGSPLAGGALASYSGQVGVAPYAASFGYPGQYVVQQPSSQGTSLPLPALVPIPDAAYNIASGPALRGQAAEPMVPNFQSGFGVGRPSATVRKTRPDWILCLSVVLAMACMVLGVLVYVVVRMHERRADLAPRATREFVTTEFD